MPQWSFASLCVKIWSGFLLLLSENQSSLLGLVLWHSVFSFFSLGLTFAFSFLVHLKKFLLDAFFVYCYIQLKIFIVFMTWDNFQFCNRHTPINVQLCQFRASQVVALPAVNVYGASFRQFHFLYFPFKPLSQGSGTVKRLSSMLWIVLMYWIAILRTFVCVRKK